MKKQLGRKVTAALLAGGLLLAVLPAQAQEQNTPKEEVVYANLHSDGTVQGVYVVNSFLLDKAGKIVDYGDYTALRNMTSSKELNFTDQKITIEADAGRLYYEGILDEATLPWNFEIKYWLDGVALSAEELAGKQGHLQIDIDITQNKDCNVVFFENYALQVTLQLDTNLCHNIQGEGATMANVGSKKQLTYTILPGQEELLSLSADVTDFTMEQISLNGVTLQMALDVDESRYPQLKEGLQKIERTAVKFDEGALDLFDGMEQLRSGANRLGDGLEDLRQGVKDAQGGVNDLQQGAAELQQGARSLYDGAIQATDGAQKVRDGARELDGAAQRLQTGTEKVWHGAEELDDGIAEALNGAGKLNDGADSLEMQIEKIELQSARLEAALEQLQQNQEVQEGLKDLLGKLEGKLPTGSQLEFEQYIKLMEQTAVQLDQAVADLEKLSGGIHELYDGIVILRQGSEELLEGIETLKDGTAELKQGTFVLQDGTVTLYEGVVQLRNGSYELLSGATELHNGTITLEDGLADLENGVVELCDGAIVLEDGIVTLEDGLIVLQGGTLEFRNGTANLDGKMLEQLRQGISELFGDGGETVSFVSEANTQVQSVQFVIRTPAIEIAEETLLDEENTQKLTFWQKLLRLFGIKA